MNKIYVIAEIGINHNGSMDLAEKLIQMSFQAGADAVKFQKRTIDTVYSKEELDKPRESPWGTTNREQKQGLEFSMEQYKKLEEITKSLGMDFIVSCWDSGSVEDVSSMSLAYHKIASALATDKEFLKKINETKLPVILSTGMCTSKQIAAALDILENVEYVLACTSTYPTKAEELNLRHILTLKETYPELKIGFSNHYNGHDACVAAAALGAECVEFHITHDRTAYGSDQAASIENAKDLVSAIRNVELMLGDGVKKVYDSELPIINKLRRKNDTAR